MKGTLIKAALILTLSELAVMGLFRLWGPGHGRLEIFLDPVLMLFLAMGPLYHLFRKEAARITRHEQLESNLRRIIEDLWNASLQTISREELLGRILDEVITNSPISIANKGAIFLVEEGALRMKASCGFTEELKTACAVVPEGRCLCGLVLATGDVVFAEHIDKRHNVSLSSMRDHGHYCIPIKSAGAVIGALNLYTAAGHKRDPLEENFLRSVCAIIARIIEGKKLEATLFQFQKMEALNRFAAGIAHDFNNILGGIQGFCDVALKTAPPGSQLAGDLGEICSAVGRGSALTRQLALFSRQAREETAVFNINEVASRLQEMTRRLSGSGIAVKLVLGAGPMNVRGNRGQIEQVLMNLAVNARDAMPTGGVFKVETSRQEVCFTGSKQCFSAVKISVSDTGTGMTEAVQERIFEPFFTTKGEGKGSGLGLSITHGIIKQHGGEILASSVPGSGSRFDIYLPANEGFKEPQDVPAGS